MHQVRHYADISTDALESVVVLRPDALIIDLQQPRRVVSSAPFRGGLTSSRYLVNHTVKNDFFTDDVEETIRAMLANHALPATTTTCALTAVDVKHYKFAQISETGVAASVYVTVGLGNLTVPGKSALATPLPGTINIFALIAADLPDAALVETLQIITEVKARRLAGYFTHDGYPATGTSTDTVTVALLPGTRQQHAGAITPVGRALARATDKALESALSQ